MSASVALIGDALLDVALAPAEPMRPGGDVPGAVTLGAGGQAANVAVRLARRGLTVRLWCAIGRDAAGRFVRDALEREGVALEAMEADATGLVGIVLDAGGERSMVSRRVAVLPALDVARLDLGGTGWLVVSGYVLMEEAAEDFARRAAALPLLRVVLGCAMGDAGEGWLRAAATLEPDLVLLNADEARALVPAVSAGDVAAALAQRLRAVVVVTDRGEAVAASDRERVSVMAPQAGEPPVDATGAGDAFAAALLVTLDAWPWPPDADALRAALEAGLAAAREVVAVPGAQGLVRSEGGGRP